MPAKKTSPPIPLTPEAIASHIMQSVVRSEELDQIHLSIQALHQIARDELFSLCIDRPNATPASVQKSIERIIDELPSPLVQKNLHQALQSPGVIFFREASIQALIELLSNAARGYSVIKLTTAITLKEPDVLEAHRILTERTNEPVALSIRVDSSIIGGAIIQHSTYVTDSSVKTQLETLGNHWQRAVIEHE